MENETRWRWRKGTGEGGDGGGMKVLGEIDKTGILFSNQWVLERVDKQSKREGNEKKEKEKEEKMNSSLRSMPSDKVKHWKKEVEEMLRDSMKL